MSPHRAQHPEHNSNEHLWLNIRHFPATPFVSGLAGLLYSYYTNFTYSQIRGTILRYVDALGLDIMTGGRLMRIKRFHPS